jgi:hypothetical protein
LLYDAPVLGNAASSWEEHLNQKLRSVPAAVLLFDFSPAEIEQRLRYLEVNTTSSSIQRALRSARKGAGAPYRRDLSVTTASS